MNEIEQAIEEFYDNAFHKSMKLTISEQSKVVALSALQEKAEWDKMRCENCKYWANGLTEKRPCHKTNAYPMIASDFCSYFEVKENENG